MFAFRLFAIRCSFIRKEQIGKMIEVIAFEVDETSLLKKSNRRKIPRRN